MPGAESVHPGLEAVGPVLAAGGVCPLSLGLQLVGAVLVTGVAGLLAESAHSQVAALGGFGAGTGTVGAVTHPVHMAVGFKPAAGMLAEGVGVLADLVLHRLAALTGPVAAVAGQVVGVEGLVAAEMLAG